MYDLPNDTLPYLIYVMLCYCLDQHIAFTATVNRNQLSPDNIKTKWLIAVACHHRPLLGHLEHACNTRFTAYLSEKLRNIYAAGSCTGFN